MKELVPWLWIGAIALVFWLIIIRPAAKRQRDMAALQQGLVAGEDVVLTSGIFGTIVAAEETHLDVQIAEGVVIQVARGAVGSVRRDAEAPEPTDDHEHDSADDPEER